MRLCGMEQPKAKRPRAASSSGAVQSAAAEGGKSSAAKIIAWIEAAGLNTPAPGAWREATFSHCAATAVAKGHLQWDESKEALDAPAVLRGGAALIVSSDQGNLACSHSWQPTLRQLLTQPD